MITRLTTALLNDFQWKHLIGQVNEKAINQNCWNFSTKSGKLYWYKKIQSDSNKTVVRYLSPLRRDRQNAFIRNDIFATLMNIFMKMEDELAEIDMTRVKLILRIGKSFPFKFLKDITTTTTHSEMWWETWTNIHEYFLTQRKRGGGSIDNDSKKKRMTMITTKK